MNNNKTQSVYNFIKFKTRIVVQLKISTDKTRSYAGIVRGKSFSNHRNKEVKFIS